MKQQINHGHEEYKALFRVASIGVFNAKQCDLNIDWEKLLPAAIEQEVLSLVACATLNSMSFTCPEAVREVLQEKLRAEAAGNMLKQNRILYLLCEMENAGFDVKILKGISVGRYYNHPECRGSVDTDILIPAEQEQDIYTFLESKGFQICERRITSHHGICQHAKYGKIEVHTRLYDEIVNDIWFQGFAALQTQIEKYEILEYQGLQYKTLGATDQLVFLALHMVKHLISHGLTIRMMFDIALHFRENSNRIDAKYFWNILSKLRYDRIVSCILWIMCLYAGFEAEQFEGIRQVSQDDVDLVMHDIEMGGYMGRKEQKARYECEMEYNRRLIMRTKNFKQYVSYMLAWKVNSGLKEFVPSRQRLTRMFPILTRHVYLTPFFFVYQMIRYPIKKVGSGVLKNEIRNDKRNLSEVANRRLMMFEQLGMI